MRTRSIDNQTQATREARNLLSSFEANPTHLAVQLRIAEALERIADRLERDPAAPRASAGSINVGPARSNCPVCHGDCGQCGNPNL